MKEITRALAFASDRYKHQGEDQTGQPFTHHLIQVLDELVQADITDTTTLIAALLHDIRQYSDTTHDEIAEQFGPDVADLVDELYYNKEVDKTELQLYLLERQVELSDQAQQIVIADLIANTTCDYYEKEEKPDAQRARASFARAIIAETPEPHKALHDRFTEVMNRFCDTNGFNQSESFWGFLTEEEQETLLARFKQSIAELREELGEEDATD